MLQTAAVTAVCFLVQVGFVLPEVVELSFLNTRHLYTTAEQMHRAGSEVAILLWAMGLLCVNSVSIIAEMFVILMITKYQFETVARFLFTNLKKSSNVFCVYARVSIHGYVLYQHITALSCYRSSFFKMDLFSGVTPRYISLLCDKETGPKHLWWKKKNFASEFEPLKLRMGCHNCPRFI